MKKDQITVHLPSQLAVTLGPGMVTPEENTVSLLRQQRDNPEWNASLIPYWESLPGFGGILTKENMPTDALHLLQDPVLAGTSSIIVHGAYTRNVFYGGKAALVESFVDEFPGVTLEHFQHLTSIVASYAFTFPNEDGVPTRMLLPLLDMLNHGNEGTANVQIIEADNGDIYAYTLRDVEAGEELTHTYTAAIRRNDQALFHYGFIQEYEPPALVEQDLPDGNLYDMSSYSEEDYDLGGRLVTRQELQRLQGILDSFPTTMAQDAAILQEEKPWWQFWGKEGPRNDLERMFIQYRIMRKQALQYVHTKLKDALIVSKEL
ncbi:g8216 [Coccomyxa viridis]|uniref:G8216 protein n=1 Tax=Coccomyxa viridis TaxID=1274662 RepID=A0ABP1G3Y4_9CHLO